MRGAFLPVKTLHVDKQKYLRYAIRLMGNQTLRVVVIVLQNSFRVADMFLGYQPWSNSYTGRKFTLLD